MLENARYQLYAHKRYLNKVTRQMIRKSAGVTGSELPKLSK